MSKLESPIVLTEPGGKDVEFPTVEHFYQAMKTKDWVERRCIAALKNPGDTVRYTKDMVVREDWDDIKLGVMYHGLKHKFSKANPKILEKARACKDMTLIEANRWNDRYYGVDWETGEGENVLGRLLMKLFKEIFSD